MTTPNPLNTNSLVVGNPPIGAYQNTPERGTLPERASIDLLNTQNDWYRQNIDLWQKLDVLYTGGNTICQTAATFLVRRPKELGEIFAARFGKFTYQNILGAAIDWYMASIFQADPEIDFKQRQPDGSYSDLSPRGYIKGFYAEFRKNCNRRGTTFIDFFREILKNLLLYQSSWVLIDLPHADQVPQTRWEQEQVGLLSPYLVSYRPNQVIDWSEDMYGNLEWVKIKVVTDSREFLQKPTQITRWYYYDRQEYRIYETREIAGSTGKQQFANLIDSGMHSLSDQNHIPVFRVQVPEGLWLANRVYPQVVDHLNTDNWLSWALFLSALAMPVLIGDIAEIPTLSEAGFIKLPKGSEITWTEPSGHSFQVLENRIDNLREEIYRSMYLMSQGRSGQATPAMQSGYSKQLDMMPSGDISNCFGDIIRAAMVLVLDHISSICEHNVNFFVRGFEFTSKPASIELQDAVTFKNLGVPSPTAEKENYKKVLDARFPDCNPSLMDIMKDEVDSAPTDEQKQQMEQEQQAQQYQQQFEQQAQSNSDAADAREHSTALDMVKSEHAAGLDMAKQQLQSKNSKNGKNGKK